MRADAALKQSKTKDYYKILGVPRSANDAAIKRAYRKLALEWHPDKVDESQKEAAAKRFQDIGEAYEVLSTPETKAKYDRGEDVTGQNNAGQPGHGHPFQHGFPGGFPGHFHFRQG
jgi:DnaJ family protein C protein 3